MPRKRFSAFGKRIGVYKATKRRKTNRRISKREIRKDLKVLIESPLPPHLPWLDGGRTALSDRAALKRFDGRARNRMVSGRSGEITAARNVLNRVATERGDDQLETGTHLWYESEQLWYESEQPAGNDDGRTKALRQEQRRLPGAGHDRLRLRAPRWPRSEAADKDAQRARRWNFRRVLTSCLSSTTSRREAHQSQGRGDRWRQEIA